MMTFFRHMSFLTFALDNWLFAIFTVGCLEDYYDNDQIKYFFEKICDQSQVNYPQDSAGDAHNMI